MGALKPNSFTAWVEKFKKLLADRRTGYFILAVIIASKVLQLLYFFNTRNDMTHQILAARHFLGGHGISSASILSSDLSTVIYEPLNKWPPGFSLLFAPFYLLFNNDYITAALALCIISAILLIFVSRSILRVLDTPSHLINLYTLFSGFFGYYFYSKPCTDAIAISFFVIGIYYALLILKKHKKFIRNMVLMILSLLLCGLIKYLFIFAVFAIPVFFILKSFKPKDAFLRKAGLASFIILLATFATYSIYQKKTSGSVAFVNGPEKGFFPENLESYFPFVTTSFIKHDSPGQLISLTEETNNSLFRVFQIIDIILLLIVFIYFLKRIRGKTQKNTPITDDFLNLSALVSLSIVTLLVFLSLSVSKVPQDLGVFWTYVEEPRYYGVISFLLHIAIFAFYPFYKTAKKPVARILMTVLFLLLMSEMFRGIIFTAHRIHLFGKESYGWQYELGFQKYTEEIVKRIRLQDNNNIVLTGSSDWMTLRASLYSKLPVFEEVGKLNTISALNTAKPVTLLAIIRNEHLPGFESFINSEGTHFEGNQLGYSFYSYPLKPL